MKTSQLLNILLGVSLLLLSVRFVTGPGSDATVTAADDSAAIDNIMSRTSIRDYQDKPVEPEKVEQMLKAAMAAPTAGNKQPWRFIVIDDRATLDSIAGRFGSMKMAAKAPIAIVVCGDLTATFPGEGTGYWIQDASAATENMLLAAHSLGLGAVWCGIYPMSERVEWLSERLQLPDSIVPLNVVPVGYPAESPAAKDKWQPSHVRVNTWATEWSSKNK